MLSLRRVKVELFLLSNEAYYFVNDEMSDPSVILMLMLQSEGRRKKNTRLVEQFTACIQRDLSRMFARVPLLSRTLSYCGGINIDLSHLIASLTN